MKIIELLRLLRKHLILLLLIPILLAGLVTYFTKSPSFTYSSETTLYTGIASGSSVEMDKSLSFFATNTAFDNLINVIKSRETQKDVAIRLLAQHLMLEKSDPRYISAKSLNYLKKITPYYVKTLVVKSNDQNVGSSDKIQSVSPTNSAQPTQKQDKDNQQHIVKENETLYSISHQYGLSVDQISEMNQLKGYTIKQGQTLQIRKQQGGLSDKVTKDSLAVADSVANNASFSFSKLDSSPNKKPKLPDSIDQLAFEQTVKNLTDLSISSDTNFVYNILNFDNAHYSVKAISTVNVQRISSSDLVKLKFTSDDPGICQQTLVFLTEVCIKNYKNIKENRSDAVVKYFEYQVNKATQKLKTGEDKLLSFNKDNNIINYYEQSKAVALAKEALDVDYNNMRIKLAGNEAAIKRLEEKLDNQQKVQLQSAPIIEKRNQLSLLNTKIVTAETIGYGNTIDGQNLALLKAQSEKLKQELHDAVGNLYSLNNTTEGLPISTLLNEWITNVVSYEDTKAGIVVLLKRIQEFQKQYEIYAPAGANLKRIEREISISEQEFLELLHGLNLAKLKMQDIELSSNLKAVDKPFFPQTANPTKRKILIVVAALVGFLAVLTTILALEFFDDTLRNPKKASKILNLSPLGIFPKIYQKPGILNFSFILHRLFEIVVQHIGLLRKSKTGLNDPFQILIFSTASSEGKTVIARNLASSLKKLGNKVILIKYSSDSIQQMINQNNTTEEITIPIVPGKQQNKFSLVNWFLGYSNSMIDLKSPFLHKYGSALLDEEEYIYQINGNFQMVAGYKELLINDNHFQSFVPDYVLIEIPPILYFPFPAGLVASVDLPIMVCRANRVWSTADQGAIDNISKVTNLAPQFLLNGVELDVIESVLGDLPKKRSKLRRFLKNLIRFQFNSRVIL